MMRYTFLLWEKPKPWAGMTKTYLMQEMEDVYATAILVH